MRTFVKLAVSVAMAAAGPWIQVRVQCNREPFSEACVWGKAYLPLSTCVSMVVFTPLIFLALWLVERRVRANGRG